MAKQQKMLHAGIRWFTNDLPTKDKKAAWESGVVYLYRDEAKGINPDMERFYSLDGILPALKKLLKRNKIKLVADRVKFVEI